MISPFIQGCIPQSYLYTPGTVRVALNVPPGFINCDEKEFAPLGTDSETIVWSAVSLLYHSIVLLTPATTVALPGENPDIAAVEDVFDPAPFGIEYEDAPCWRDHARIGRR